MNPEQPMGAQSKEARNLRLIIVVGLVLVLLAIVTAYIYYGMQFAKHTTAPTPEEPVLSESDRIMQALESAPVASPEDFAAVNAALEGAEVTTTANPADILKAMGEPAE